MSTIARARSLARELDSRLGTLGRFIPVSSTGLFLQIRGYLVKQDRRIGTGQDLERIVRYDKASSDSLQIFLGPAIDKKQQEDTFFNFPSGARLSFSIALRDRKEGCEILSYRFHFRFPEGHSPEFIRIDLLDKSHADPLTEPLAHIHPGIDAVRLPCPPLTPIEVLDRVFFVLDPNTRSKT